MSTTQPRVNVLSSTAGTPVPLPTQFENASNVDGQSTLGRPSQLAPATRDGRSLSSASLFPPRGASFAASTLTGPMPGSFSADMRSTATTPRPDFSTHTSYRSNHQIEEDEVLAASKARQKALVDQINRELKIKSGSENLLEALNSKNAKQSKDQKFRVEQELNTSSRKLAQLRQDLEVEELRAQASRSDAKRLSFLGRGDFHRPQSQDTFGDGGDEDDEQPDAETESPSFVLSEILQALEEEDMPASHYVNNANKLVDLFKRHPTLKHDLAWSIFGLRIQTILLSDSREVVAAGYRMIRTAITDRKSLQTIRSLGTDWSIVTSLVKENRANIEREQALKLVRAFLDVKGGVYEISRGIVRILVAIAEHNDDKLRSVAILTLAEMLVRDPTSVADAGGIGTLMDAMSDGTYQAAPSLTAPFLYLLDTPARRTFLMSGSELQAPMAAFTDAPIGNVNEAKLKLSARVVAALLKTWQGLFTLAMNDFLAIRSLMTALYIPVEETRDVLLDLLINILGIKPPSWGSSFLAGRRLTTYARVTNMKAQPNTNISAPVLDSDDSMDLVEHFTAVLLGSLLHAGLLGALLYAQEESRSEQLKRKTTLVLGEVLRLANEVLPASYSQRMQVLPNLLVQAALFNKEERFVAIGTIYQVDSVNRTLYRSASTAVQHARPLLRSTGSSKAAVPTKSSLETASADPSMDEGKFRAMMVDTGVLASNKYWKWQWGLILNIIEGPLLLPKRLEEADRTKFLPRIMSFFQPFKRRFCEIRNTKPNQRYVKYGCALMTTLLDNDTGAKYLSDSKLIRQLAENLSSYDRVSGIHLTDPLFTTERMQDKLDAGYFAMLGVLSKNVRGLQILGRWNVFNIMYHVVEVPGRDDLIKVMLSNMEYLQDSHPRIMLSKALTSCSKHIRIFLTRLLRKYATQAIATTDDDGSDNSAIWAIKLLATQLYDPEIEVCEVAIKILEEASNQKHSLEYIVKCRPSLDHLGEIGAPLLLRFLSTSIGYHYLDGMDYISREMDDWFLGRNDSYVAIVEASLERAMSEAFDAPKADPRNQYGFEEAAEMQDFGIVPTHFYRELARTKEGCRLLEEKGHFDEFATTIRECGMEDDDAETILKVKGCLWAVGNVGSMDLGAPFLETTNIVKDIVHIAEQSPVMSLRGTAVFVLGLISRSLHGQEILFECGWDAAVNIRGESNGCCIPLKIEKLFSVSVATIHSKPTLTRPRSSHGAHGVSGPARAPLSLCPLLHSHVRSARIPEAQRPQPPQECRQSQSPSIQTLSHRGF